MRTYHVYILSSISRVLYTGVTSDLYRRVWQHKNNVYVGFTARYNVKRLVYFEEHLSVRGAIAREKQIKRWKRVKKERLVEARNPTWMDLSANWYR